MHVSRGGPLATNVMSETKQGLDQVVRERAYLLWEMEAVRMSGRMNAGIAPMSSIFASVPVFFGGRRVARWDGPTKIGTGPKNLSHSLVLHSLPRLHSLIRSTSS